MERLADKTISLADVTSQHSAEPPVAARTVVIGSGLIGTSAAYHLALSGDDDIIVLERNTVGSGTSWHAAGLTSSIRATPALTDLAAYGVSFYQRLQELSGLDVNFNQCGSLILARTAGRLDELRYTAAIARQKGIPADLIAPDSVPALWPLASTDGLVGALHQPQDGHLNPGVAAVAMAKLAHDRGVRIFESVEVLEVLSENGAVTGVLTTGGTISCERVLLAAGLWTRDLAHRSGATVPLYAAEHVHTRTEPIDGANADLPTLRDLDGYFYVRHEQGRLLVGAFEPNGKPRRTDEIAGDFVEFEPDWQHFAAVRANAEQRIPALRSCEYDRFLNAPESFTPDANFLMGETAEVANLYVAAGFNSQGVIYAPGAGRAMAEWISSGSATFDAAAVDVQRFSKHQRNRRYLHSRTHEALGRLYAMHWPQLQAVTARDVRRTPLFDRLQRTNACFGEVTGWERANWFAPRGVTPGYEYSYGRANWFDAVGLEHQAAREAAAVFDLSSFTKIEVAGPDALDVIQIGCTAQMDRPVGKVQYTLMLNVNGGIELDGTVVRLADDRFLVITPAFSQTKTLEYFSRIARGRAAAVFDATAGLATIGVMGPASRELLSRISPEDWSDSAQKYTQARHVEIADGFALALRVSFVGELGYEIYPSADLAVNVYDAIMAAGADLGARPAGYFALDSLRSEKGYRHLGHDIGPADDPYESGLGFTVSKKKTASFLGREALERRAGEVRKYKTGYLALHSPDPLLLHDETILLGGRAIGRMTSGAYGYTLNRACGIARIEADVDMSQEFLVDCGGQLHSAEISDQPFYDPSGSRLRG